jgi:hypothetical protein
MSWIAAAVIGSTVVGGVLQSSAQKSASDAQVKSAEAGIEEQRRQFDAVQKLLQPFVETGTTALGQQAALIGAGGPEAQRSAIQALEQGPEFQALTRQGEEAILQQAAATGGLRGGNVQGALAQFRPQVLASLIDQQYNRLGGLAQAGQASAAGVGSAGMQTGANISNLMQQQGAARAGGALAQGQTWGNVFGGIAQYGGLISSGAVANPFATQSQFVNPAASTIRPMPRPF